MASEQSPALDTPISPAFHPLSITEAEFFDEDTQPALQQVADVFSTVHASLGSMVCAHEPLPDDCFVQTYLDGPQGRRLLVTQDMTRYQAAVDWAVSMADQMVRPIHIVPISAAEFVKKHREGLAQLDHQQRGKLRQVAVASMLEVMRDCPDPKVRAQAHKVLTTLEVGQ